MCLRIQSKSEMEMYHDAHPGHGSIGDRGSTIVSDGTYSLIHEKLKYATGKYDQKCTHAHKV